MATAPMSSGQMKELASACVEAIPADLSAETAQKWIGRKRELGNRLRSIFMDNEVSNLSNIDLRQIYCALGMEAEYSEAIKDWSLVEDKDLWTLLVVKGVTCNKVVSVMKRLGVNFYLYTEDLDKNVTVNDRDPESGSYIIGFKRTVEADEVNKNLSANELSKRSHKGITLLERLLLELGYFLAAGGHLDINNWTLCSGSRYSGGHVPSVRWDSDYRRVRVYWYSPGLADGYLRSRSAVSLSVNPKD